MKPRDPAEVMQDNLRLDGYVTAVRVLVDRHGAFATAADLMRLMAPDAPGFLLAALYAPGTRETLIDLSAKLDRLAASDDPAAEGRPSISIEREVRPSGPWCDYQLRLECAGPDVQREGRRRVDLMMSIERLTDCGRTLAEAIALVSAASDVPEATLIAWRMVLRGVPTSDWYPHLAFADAGGVAPSSAAA